MPGYAPAAIRAAAQTITDNMPGTTFAGIAAPANSTPGYHWPRASLPAGHYTCQMERDRGGDAEASSGLDITLAGDLEHVVIGRFRDAIAAGDPRLAGLAEIAGTLDGRNVWSWTAANGVQTNVYDQSHLWHVHIGGFRDAANDAAAWAGIASVFIGAAGVSTDWLDTVDRKEVSDLIDERLNVYFAQGEGRPGPGRVTAAARDAIDSAFHDPQENALAVTLRQFFANGEGNPTTGRVVQACRTALAELDQDEPTTAPA